MCLRRWCYHQSSMDSGPTKPTTSLRQQSLQSLRQQCLQSLRQQSQICLRQKPTTTKLTTSLNPFGSHMRESLVCTSPFFHWLLLLRVRVLVSCQSSYNSHQSDYCKSSSPIKLFALAQLSTARKLSCLYPRRQFHQYYLWWYNYTTTLLWWTLLL